MAGSGSGSEWGSGNDDKSARENSSRFIDMHKDLLYQLGQGAITPESFVFMQHCVNKQYLGASVETWPC